MMFKKLLFDSNPLYRETGLGIVRIFFGAFMVYHGWEIFDQTKMNEYSKWMNDLKLSSPAFMSYLGKGIELIAGVFVLAGLFTRIAVIPLAITMLFICFFIGEGRIFMEEQHPFMFVLLSLLFFFTGPGRWSLDKVVTGDTRKALSSETTFT
jgi:putative oxidoreductase